MTLAHRALGIATTFAGIVGGVSLAFGADYTFEAHGLMCMTRDGVRVVERVGEIVFPAPPTCRQINAGETVEVLSIERQGRRVIGEARLPGVPRPSYFISFEPEVPPSGTAATVPATGAIACVSDSATAQVLDEIAKGRGADHIGGRCVFLPEGLVFTAFDHREIHGFKGSSGWAPKIRNGEIFSVIMLDDLDKRSGVPRDQAPSERTTAADGSASFKLVSPRDVSNSPSKWLGRSIEFKNVKIYWVADDDVRFITDTMLTVFASNVRSSDAVFLRQNCETERELHMPKCRVNIKFRYQHHSEDKPNGYMTRTVLQTSDIEVTRAGSAKSRNR